MCFLSITKHCIAATMIIIMLVRVDSFYFKQLSAPSRSQLPKGPNHTYLQFLVGSHFDDGHGSEIGRYQSWRPFSARFVFAFVIISECRTTRGGEEGCGRGMLLETRRVHDSRCHGTDANGRYLGVPRDAVELVMECGKWRKCEFVF